MALHRSSPSGDGFSLRMAALYAAIFAFAGISLPFLPVWLRAKGLDPHEIGVVLAAAMVARPAIVPLAMRVFDRFGWARGPLVAAAWAAFASFIAVAFSDGFAAILIAYAISSLPQTLVMPLAEAYALRGLAERAGAYGRVRLWGSAAFIAANIAGGLLLGPLGAMQVIWTLIAALFATALAATALAPLPEESRTEEDASPKNARSLWRSPGFVAVVLAASLIQASHAVYYGFSSLQWTTKGLGGPVIGSLWGLGVAAEIALFAASGRILARLGAVSLIGLGALGAVARWTAMAFDPPAAMLPLLQGLHALTFGATHLGTMHFLAHFAAEGRGATAQGDYSAAVAILSAAAMALAGLLVDAFGTYAYFAMAASAAAGGAIILAAPGQRA